MLIEFIVSNFRSIKNKIELSMLPSSRIKDDVELDNNLISYKNDTNLLSSVVIYGRNASGKSNLLKALESMLEFVVLSKEYSEGEKIKYFQPYKLEKEFENQPSTFEIHFVSSKNKRYKYYIEFTSSEVIKESLYFYPNDIAAKLFIREKGRIVYGDKLKGNKKNVEKNLKQNQLFLSKSSVDNFELLNDAYSFFSESFFVTTSNDSSFDRIILDLYTSNLKREKDVEFNTNLNKLISYGDAGIEKIQVKELNTEEFKFPSGFSDEMKSNIIEKNKFKIKTLHTFFEGGEEKGTLEFSLNEESTGTQKLIVIGGLIIEALQDGQVLVIDELDKNLHPLLTRAVIQLFNNPKTNPNKAQLIFATHDISLLDNTLFRRDQIWFSEKDYEGVTSLYSLSDIKGVRKQDLNSKWYLDGRFKAIPIFDEPDFDIIIKPNLE